jgi:Helix-turn-helix domain
MAWCFDCSHAELGARLVLLSIANHANPRGSNAYASAATIAGEARLTKRQVYRALPTLVALGELLVWHNGGPVVRGGRLNRYELPLVPGWERPEDMPADSGEGLSLPPEADLAASGEGLSLPPEAEVVTYPLGSGDKSDLEVVTNQTSAPYIEPNRTRPEPSASASGGEVVLASFSEERTAALQALTGGALEPGPQLVAAMLAGGWLRLIDVPDVPAAVSAYLDSLDVKPHTPRRVLEQRGREAVKGGALPGQFLATLCSANTFSPLAMDLARNRVARADLPGMSGMRPQRPSLPERATQQRAERKAARAAASNVIDAESFEGEDLP